MLYLVLTIHIILCFALIGLVLLQQGKGAEMGATLGGGSNTLFGAGGATNLVIKTTTAIAIAFMGTSIMLIRIYNKEAMVPTVISDPTAGSVMEGEQSPPVAPPADASAPVAAPTENKTENSAGEAVDKKVEETQSSNASTGTSDVVPAEQPSEAPPVAESSEAKTNQ